MPTLDDVYRKLGETVEAAQLLETELGTMLLMVRGLDEGLLAQPDPNRATEIYYKIDRHTLGQLIKALGEKTQLPPDLGSALLNALEQRNRLLHSFYRQHNLRRNSDEGRAIMLADLESIYDTLLRAYKAVMLLSGVDLEAWATVGEHVGPTGHLPI
jgi:hypothetical protein